MKHLLGAGSQSTQIGNALVKSLLLLLRGDGGHDILNNPINHMFLIEATFNVTAFNLVIQATLDL